MARMVGPVLGDPPVATALGAGSSLAPGPGSCLRIPCGLPQPLCALGWPLWTTGVPAARWGAA
jgi:hypothetical protein